MTIQDVEKMEKTMLTPAEVSAVIGCDPNMLRYQARTAPEQLGFPTIVIRRRVKIPRLPFLAVVAGRESN